MTNVHCAFDKNGTVHRLNGRTVGVRITNTHINFVKAKKYPEKVYTCGQEFLVIILNIFWSCAISFTFNRMAPLLSTPCQ